MATRHTALMRLLVLLAAVALAGCTDAGYVEEYQPPARTFTLPVAQWPDVQDASIRPGVNVVVTAGDSSGSCTSNFLFRSPDNATLYLGLAAHCFGEVATGTTVQVGEYSGGGRIAFNAWDHVDDDERLDHDFGLVALSAHVRGAVHPAVLYYGGPTGIADSTQVMPGTKVITYGHSIQRPPADPENPREGWVLTTGDRDPTSSPNQIKVYTDHPGIQGDSGSGLMTRDGGALGVLSLGTTNPASDHVENRDMPALNWYVALDQVLAHAASVDGPPVELVTWPLINGPALPI